MGNQRYPEIDFLRGVAITMMIVYHFFFDLNFFSVYTLQINSGLWWIFGRSTAFLFIFLFGLCLTISHSRVRKKGKNLWKKHLRRGVWIFSLGLLITLVTYLYLGTGFIIFGILHLIGLSIILAYPFMRFKKANLLLGILIILIGIYSYSLTFDFPYLLWLGLKPYHFYTVDYFPILPWFGVVLLGIFAGNHFYPEGNKTSGITIKNSFVQWMGRNSLIIYLIHQPILVFIISLLFSVKVV